MRRELFMQGLVNLGFMREREGRERDGRGKERWGRTPTQLKI
jgi:hypothetical protein